jgi:hypothetical protein
MAVTQWLISPPKAPAFISRPPPSEPGNAFGELEAAEAAAGGVHHQLLERRRGAGAHVPLRVGLAPVEHAQGAAELEDDAAHAAIGDEHVGADPEHRHRHALRAPEALQVEDLLGALHLHPRVGGDRRCGMRCGG